MKRIFFLLMVLLVAITSKTMAQTPAEQLAEKIAVRLRDSLALTDTQKQGIYTINMQLHNQKNALRSQYTDMAILQHHMQAIENRRDSLYKAVIANEEKYLLYKQKKKELVKAN